MTQAVSHKTIEEEKFLVLLKVFRFRENVSNVSLETGLSIKLYCTRSIIIIFHASENDGCVFNHCCVNTDLTKD